MRTVVYSRLIKNQLLHLNETLIDTHTLEKHGNAFWEDRYKDIDQLNDLKKVELYYIGAKEDSNKWLRQHKADTPMLDRIECKTKENQFYGIYADNIDWSKALYYEGDKELDSLVEQLKEKYYGFYYDFGWNHKGVIKFRDDEFFFKPTFLSLGSNEIGIQIHTTYHTLCSISMLKDLLTDPRVRAGSNIELVMEKDLADYKEVNIEIPVRPW